MLSGIYLFSFSSITVLTKLLNSCLFIYIPIISSSYIFLYKTIGTKQIARKIIYIYYILGG
jgi:hypothetical protein